MTYNKELTLMDKDDIISIILAMIVVGLIGFLMFASVSYYYHEEEFCKSSEGYINSEGCVIDNTLYKVIDKNGRIWRYDFQLVSIATKAVEE